jgi:hypothetical protein
MGYASRLYRFNVVANTPGEQVVNTVWMRADAETVGTAGLVQLLTDKVRDEWTRMFLPQAGDPPSMSGAFASSTVWSKVTGYKVDALGKAQEQAESAFTPATKGANPGAMPPQVALVVTLLTALPGRSGRGRIYLGGLSAAITENNGRLFSGTQPVVAAAMTGFYKRLRNTPNAQDLFRPVVVSPTTTTANKITRISVGDVFDTQRSRRKGLQEFRQFGSVDE